MRHKTRGVLALIFFSIVGAIIIFSILEAQQPSGAPAIPRVWPRVWDDKAIATLEVPLADPSASPVPVSSDYYYGIPVRPVYKSYPVYQPGKEPAGYLESLRQKEPEIIFDPAKLKTEADWTKAGENVFDVPILYEPVTADSPVRDPAWYKKAGVPVTKDGIMPFARYVVRKKGQVELGRNSCATCHTRVMSDGTAYKGPEGNFPYDRSFAYSIRAGAAKAEDKARFLEATRLTMKSLFAAPWLRPDPNARLDQMSIEEIASALEAIPPGLLARNRASVFYPVHVPDLTGVKEKNFLGRTGLSQNRTIEDLIRYTALHQGADDLASYAGFIPADIPRFQKLPDPKTQGRYGDEQLYALVLYLYSLEPPPNPNKEDRQSKKGEDVFNHKGCVFCHTPPLFTDNKLSPAEGFQVPEKHVTQYDVLTTSVNTEPSLALKTRRGTGYYKVMSLRGLWNRSVFGHSGAVASLEDWFDPKRIKDDYVPTGFKPNGVKAGGVKGHLFGLDLNGADRKALIAFIKTL